MSLYAQYLSERTDDKIIESSFGFATYRFLNDKQVYVVDIYIDPEHRNKRAGSDMVELIAAVARSRGCSEMLGTVVPSCKNSTTSLKILLADGMKLDSASDNLIVFKKEI